MSILLFAVVFINPLQGERLKTETRPILFSAKDDTVESCKQ
jgi:hypothetical protein